MDEDTPSAGGPLTHTAISAATSELGWRYMLGGLHTSVPVGSLAEAAEVAARVAAAAGADAGSLTVDLRPDRALVGLRAPAVPTLGAREITLAGRLTELVRTLGRRTDPEVGAGPRSVQRLEIAIDALDIPAIRPFWQAVLGYGDEVGETGPAGALADPFGQDPPVWFQQMDAPRAQRNRIHLDISVPHDEAPSRLEAALAAGGTLVSDAAAPSFWVLADAEGNEACISTWQGRDR